MAKLFQGRSLSVVRWLLARPNRSWTLSAMHDSSGVSVPFVGRVFQTLEAAAYVDRKRGATGLNDRDGLLDAWAAAPAPQTDEVQGVFLPGLQALLRKVQVGKAPPPHALTAEAAADFVSPLARYSRMEMYVRDADEWLAWLKLTAVPKGGNVVLIESADPGVFSAVERKGALQLVCRPQLYVDLKRRGGAAAEAADSLKRSGKLWTEGTLETSPAP